MMKRVTQTGHHAHITAKNILTPNQMFSDVNILNGTGSTLLNPRRRVGVRHRMRHAGSCQVSLIQRGSLSDSSEPS